MSVRLSRGDLAVSLGLAALALTEIWVTPSPLSVPQRAGESASVGLIAGLFLFRRCVPLLSAGAALLVLAAVSVALTDGRAWEIGVVMLASYAGARHAGLAGAVAVMLLALAYGVLISILEVSDGFWMYVGNFLFLSVLMIAIPWAAGWALQQRHRLSRRDAGAAVEQERTRIARELHDVVGHALGVIVVQAEGERAALSRSAGSAADSTVETLGAIAQCARDALDDVRRLLVVMRTPGRELAPQPGLGDLERLLDGMAAAGLPAELVIRGDQRRLPAGVELSAYRVVQEALTNTLRHAPGGRAMVVLDYGSTHLGIEVTDQGGMVQGSGAPGFGLLGMRERVALFGGSVDAGTQAAGGYRVAVRLPIEGSQSDDAARAGL